MKKILLILFTVCFSAQFSFGQQAAIDTNSNCNMATLITASNIYIPTYDKFSNDKSEANYCFIATSTNAKLIIKSKGYIAYAYVDSLPICDLNQWTYFAKGFDSLTMHLNNLKIGKKYFYKINKHWSSKNDNFESGIRNINPIMFEDFQQTPKYIYDNQPFNFNIGNYSFGRDNNDNCTTNKSLLNIIDLFVKFKAAATSCTLNLNLDNAYLESRLFLKNNYTCQAIQSNKNIRTDTFTGLTIGNEYTVRIEIGGDAALGYARTATANNASITLVGGSVTGVENNSQPTFSIAPNPSNGNFTFVSDENADIVISDLLGSKVADLQNVIPNQNIDLQLPKGIYLLHVSNAKGSKIEKLVIE